MFSSSLSAMHSAITDTYSSTLLLREHVYYLVSYSSHPLGIKRETLGKTENERLSGRGNRKKVGLIFCLGERTRQKKNCERENKTKNGRKGGRHEIYSMDESKGRQQKKKTVRKCK